MSQTGGIETVDLTKVLTPYASCWVALSKDEKRVVSSVKHPKEALGDRGKLPEGSHISCMWGSIELIFYAYDDSLHEKCV